MLLHEFGDRWGTAACTQPAVERQFCTKVNMCYRKHLVKLSVPFVDPLRDGGQVGQTYSVAGCWPKTSQECSVTTRACCMKLRKPGLYLAILHGALPAGLRCQAHSSWWMASPCSVPWLSLCQIQDPLWPHQHLPNVSLHSNRFPFETYVLNGVLWGLEASVLELR